MGRNDQEDHQKRKSRKKQKPKGEANCLSFWDALKHGDEIELPGPRQQNLIDRPFGSTATDFYAAYCRQTRQDQQAERQKKHDRKRKRRKLKGTRKRKRTAKKIEERMEVGPSPAPAADDQPDQPDQSDPPAQSTTSPEVGEDVEMEDTRFIDPPPSQAVAPSFLGLPTEIREQIYKYLLVSDDPISVCNTWNELLRRNCRTGYGIDTSILTTNMWICQEALAVLYGWNKFEYKLRDGENTGTANTLANEDGSSDEDGQDKEARCGISSRKTRNSMVHYTSRRLSRVFNDTHPSFRHKNLKEKTIDVQKYGHMFRYIHIIAERNRYNESYRTNMGKAILAFCQLVPLRPRIHTITIEVTPQRIPVGNPLRQDEAAVDWVTFIDFFDPKGVTGQALRTLPCQFICIKVHTEVPMATGDQFVEILLDMRPEAFLRRAKKNKCLWKGEALMEAQRTKAADDARMRLWNLPQLVLQAYEDNEELIDADVNQAHGLDGDANTGAGSGEESDEYEFEDSEDDD